MKLTARGASDEARPLILLIDGPATWNVDEGEVLRSGRSSRRLALYVCLERSFGDPFVTAVAALAIAYPTDGYVLSEAQFHAVAAARGHRSQRVHLVTVESGDALLTSGGIYSGTLPPYADYVSLVQVPLETALFGSGWGVLTSHEDHALIGGDDDFVDTFKSIWASNPNGGFVRTLMPRLKE